MKKAKKATVPAAGNKKVSKNKVNPTFTSLEDAPFFKKKMAKGARMIAIAGLPK